MEESHFYDRGYVDHLQGQKETKNLMIDRATQNLKQRLCTIDDCFLSKVLRLHKTVRLVHVKVIFEEKLYDFKKQDYTVWHYKLSPV